ncbi:MAG TPA: PQQ-binding-like beta-propeller repeat protein [Candidatus Baltobacteraceae bacterium]|nr:PQQ-binding-like beta-propeller repeat protein [Candidatus Baltobacteraceae bacterium]
MKKFLAAGLAAAWMLSVTIPASATAGTWSQFLDGPSHNSYVADPAISTSNASTFGVKWMAHLFSADLGSPVVAYNATLGKYLVYVGNSRGDLFAIDANTGQEVWSTNFGVGDSEYDTPAVASDGTVWVGTNYNATLYKVNGATGATICSVKSPNGHAVQGSPLIVTPPGGSETVYWDTDDSGINGPLVSTNESTCAQNFNDTIVAGSWATPSFGVSTAGTPIVMTGTADPTCNEQAYNALTGAELWSTFLAIFKPCDADVGNAASISPPGVNGFADGVAYVADDDATENALDLATGKILWSYNSYGTIGGGGKHYQIATMALDGNAVVYGYYNGINSLNATTGAVNWAWTAPDGVDSSPAIIGPKGSEIVAGSDISGVFRIFSLASGAQLYNYQTNGYLVASPAEYNGMVYITNGAGYLYAFGPGGGNGSPPSETLASPTNGQKLANPNGSVTISGTATDGKGVSTVEVAIQENGSSGDWYDAATNTWNKAPVRNAATVASPGSTSTGWSFNLPVPSSGNNYEVFVNTSNTSHIVDTGTTGTFSVSPSLNAPTIHTSLYDVAPGGSFTATGNAFKPGETATFSLFGTTVATATVGASGNVPQTTIGVPTGVTFGPTSLTLTGNTSGKSATAEVYIANEWTQQGYSSLRTYEEPNDYVINHTIFAGPSVLNVDWNYSTGAAIDTTPAVKDGIAYVGNDAGIMSALTVSSGAKTWSYTIPSAQPIRSSPALDDKTNVIFGANDGKLYVLNSSGSPVTSIALSGDLGAPAYGNNNIVIGSSTGQLWSIADPSWKTNWTANAGSPINVPVVYDPPQGLVFVGTSSGKVIAYSSSTGAVKWTATTGGAINGLSAINLLVYAGSADGKAYALNLRTGAVEWSLSGDGSAVTSVDANGGGLAFGTANGGLYDVSSKGNIYYNRNYVTSPVIGFGGAGTDEFGAYANGDLGMLRAADGQWFYQSGAKYTVGPVVMDGMLLQGAQNGNLVTFIPTNYQVPPQASVRLGSALVVVDGTGCTTAP